MSALKQTTLTTEKRAKTVSSANLLAAAPSSTPKSKQKVQHLQARKDVETEEDPGNEDDQQGDRKSVV